jgi:hypothetical protein
MISEDVAVKSIKQSLETPHSPYKKSKSLISGEPEL